MPFEPLTLPPEPQEAVETILEASRSAPVLVFKKSPICPVSFAAEREYEAFLSGLEAGADLRVAVIDVIAEKPLARGLTAALDLAHASPQALFFDQGELRWHDSHDRLTRESFAVLLGPPAG